ncbi:putative ribonuclease H-like superfamily, exonuclease, RNase T/DNA polymerase III [Helianthus annuus]|uniref:Putative polynucleotidyl transferase, ribonuclease H-like superfamily protein n=1 Tax=Helianthus annuus TaxID=4232 RepID=A0A251U9A5_HELAN|nr:protein NEN1 [Helianthus annuus]KAF5796834.1 putative ribonuclease H-like superfamily, exonuclease, RNase T/DNA polymerase III [Helianthus annuus]KAJ0540102.1 putative ribonuclease H-like superfamily, exonuclease, RNase T/DNA polymerase III [Helianthus annuus]KAJ0548526.1 putative ribonuclease H-like superfamily, exonuclease, RNase T/DNA polymerase III [Helianthus annuus]KAJ0554846.1 putative ribonuclease H-like superfamily, exonuclease, RNase T/DNA polymerase III [Helianthus annuus]KAJ0720
MEPTVDRSEIAFFDLETTVPTRPGQGFAILEFGSILVCPRKIIELESYETLVRPHDLSLITTLSVRANGITADDVASAPTFSDVADKVFDMLHGRIWAGHNIIRFDCVRLREAFAQINRPPPEPKGTIDSLALLTQRFGRRAGNMKMATLANYFGLGKQSHRSLDDVRMNLEVLKYCATVLFLESSLPDIFTGTSSVSPNTTTRNRSNAKADVDGPGLSTSPPSSTRNTDNQISPPTHDPVELGRAQPDPFDLGPLVDKIETEPLQPNDDMEEEPSIATQSNTITESNEFLEPDEVSIPSVTVTAVPFFRGPQKIQILHRDTPLQIHCGALKVRFGVSTRFVDHAGRPRLNFVVDASPNLCGVLDACDNIAKRFVDSDSNSEWRPVVSRKPGFYNAPTVRFQLPTVAEGDGVRWITEIYQKESSSASIQHVVFSKYDVAELEQLIRPGSFVDAYISLDPYDYQQNAGIRLVAKKLIVDSN